jgi:acetate kinase
MVSQDKEYVLTLNGGSSSIKFAIYQADEKLERRLDGKVERIGLSGTTLQFNDILQGEADRSRMESADYRSVVVFLLDWLERQVGFAHIRAVGHRVVHGMQHSAPELISPPLLEELHRISPYVPEHLPGEIELIEQLQQRYPLLPQVACFDTAFHHTLPRVARLLPVPRRFAAMGLQRYGFHGISYTYLMDELTRSGGAQAAQGRVILAHLGNGASLAAVLDGKSIDTSMGFTPAGGLVMGTRSGDLDPGATWFMMQSEHLDAEQFNRLINHQSGLLGVSESSSDMRDLLACEATDVRAAEAVELFCYQVKKWIGAYAAALNGLDTLVFAGGIGENAPSIRARICDGLAFLGVEVDEKSNAANAGMISTTTARVAVRVMHTDEELMIARSVSELLQRVIAKED